MLGSVVHLTLDEGYAALTDPQIAQFAGISTEAFHRQFRNKEECFLAVLDEFAAEALDVRARRRCDGADSWPEAACRAWRRSSRTSSPTRRCCGSRSSTCSKSARR